MFEAANEMTTMWNGLMRRLAGRGAGRRHARRTRHLGTERLERRAMCAAAQLSAAEVAALLARASAATPSTDAIIAVVDRSGTILGARTEASVAPNDLGFKIDGAVAKARTGAFFSNGEAILTSRTVSHISQSTITQREVQANPAGLTATTLGPGYVAPVSVGGQFPPGILNQPLVDLFAIEHTNRTSVVVGGKTVTDRSSYAGQIGTPGAPVSRGIATMPGGLAIYRAGTNEVIGGIGVFFPGPNGYADFEQGFVPSAAQTRTDRLNAPKALEAEVIALKTLLNAGDLGLALAPQLLISRAGVSAGLPQQTLVTRINTAARIDLGGIALQSFGPQAGPLGVQTLFNLMGQLGSGVVNGTDQPVGGGMTVLPGSPQPDGWLVGPTASLLPGGLTAAQVTQLVNQAVVQAGRTRAQIRTQPMATRMVIAIADIDGTVLGVFRMPDATVFSIDVAIAKARNTAYYASAALNPLDRVAGVPLLTAFSNRAFRYLAAPAYPSGNSNAAPGPFSILNTAGINPRTGLNVGAPLPAAAFNSTVLGYDSFNPGTNFRAATPGNGVVFFPGSTSIYTRGKLAGGYGVSGDGVEQDDVVTYVGGAGYLPAENIRVYNFFVRGIRLPYIKFSRNAMAGL
jgi:uncharacterized protein GlcG (DUF336 family)